MKETVSEPEPAGGRKAENTCAELLKRAESPIVIKADAIVIKTQGGNNTFLSFPLVSSLLVEFCFGLGGKC